MHQFTEKDILEIKDKVNYYIQVISGGGSLSAYVDAGIINQEQYVIIKNYIAFRKLTGSKPLINFYPLPQELQPLIDLAQHTVTQTKQKTKKPQPKYYPTNYDSWSSSSYDNSWGYGD